MFFVAWPRGGVFGCLHFATTFPDTTKSNTLEDKSIFLILKKKKNSHKKSRTENEFILLRSGLKTVISSVIVQGPLKTHQ